MLLIECNKIKKYFDDRLILDIDHLRIYSEDRIGIVGRNGVGKTTLINILSQRLQPDEGFVKLHGNAGYISQLEPPERNSISGEIASKFGIITTWNEYMSGGEKTRFKIAQTLDDNNIMLFADEPTSNVDMQGIELMEEKLREYTGAIIVISHDRRFLDKICNKIIEIEFGKIKSYKGNYSKYKELKAQERQTAQLEYEEYLKEKKRLEQVINKTKQRSKSVKQAPKRMGNSEARLHKMGGQKAKSNLDKIVKNVEKRIEHMDVKEKPNEQGGIKLDIIDSSVLHNKIIIEGRNINKAFDDKIIFREAEFTIYNGSKVALIGPNGCGKTTLIKMITNKDDSIRIAQRAKIGYFRQDINLLNNNASIIENVMESSIYSENFARLLLARLLFKGDAIYKKVDILSGGERVKVSLAKILLQDFNLLILDEPTNYMDIDALEAIEETLKKFGRTLLFVSHDRSFVDAVADHIMVIENEEIKLFAGTYSEYMSKCIKSTDNQKIEIEKQIIVLKNRLSEVIGRISMPSKEDDVEVLDKEYHEILKELKRLNTSS